MKGINKNKQSNAIKDMNLNDYNYIININIFSREKRRINKTTNDNQMNNYY